MTLNFDKAIKEGVEQAMKECELTIGMTLKEAVEKQIPIQHHHTRIVEVNCKARENVCPACLGVIITTENEYPKYCVWCGQKINWGDSERKKNYILNISQ